MLSIYGIEKEWITLLGMMEPDEETGELDPAWEQLAQELLAGGGAKVDRCAGVIKMLRDKATTAKDEAKRIRARAEMWTGQADRLRDRLGDLLDTLGERKIQGERHTVSRTKPRERLEIESAEAVPSVYHVPQPPKLDKTSIKRAIKGGADVPGAAIVLGEAGVMIR